MGLFNRKPPKAQLPDMPFVEEDKSIPGDTPTTSTPANGSVANVPFPVAQNDSVVTAGFPVEKRPVTTSAVLLGAIASIGGFMFGYESGQISGKLYLRNSIFRYLTCT